MDVKSSQLIKIFGFDTETSGRFVEQYHQILTAALVQKSSPNKIDKKIDLKLQLRDNAVVDESALVINGLSPNSYGWSQNAIPYNHAQKQIENFVLSEAEANSLLVGMAYNAPFDCSFLDDMFKGSYLNFNKMFDIVIDPWILAKKLVDEKKIITKEIMSPKSFKYYKSTKMQDVAEALNTKGAGAPHTALADVLTMFLTVEKMWEIHTNGRSIYSATAEELAPFTIEAKNLIEENERMVIS